MAPISTIVNRTMATFRSGGAGGLGCRDVEVQQGAGPGDPGRGRPPCWLGAVGRPLVKAVRAAATTVVATSVGSRLAASCAPANCASPAPP
jgi:hypothetical protein